MFLNQIVAATSAILRSVQHGPALGIRRTEWVRYLKKSISFGLCYAGFGIAGRMREAWDAGEAAFLCCAYDVVTDWRLFDTKSRVTFEKILCERVQQSEIQELAIGLYEKELNDGLAEDGLERGAIALRFTLKMMGCEKAREVAWGDLDELGRLLQIVDDVLDYEEDVVSGDTNCLRSVRRSVYLRQLISQLGSADARRLFGDTGSVLISVVEMAGRKAEALLRAEEVSREVIEV